MNNTIFTLLFSLLIVLGTHLYLLNPKRLFNKLNAIVLFLAAGVTLTEWNIFRSEYIYDVIYYEGFHTLFVSLVTLVEGLCAFYFARPFESHPKEKLINQVVTVFLSVVCFVVIYSTSILNMTTTILPDKINGKWHYIMNDNNIYGTILTSWYLIMVIIISFCFFIAYRKATIKKERVWKFWLFIAFTTLPVIIFISFLWLPSNNTSSSYEMSPLLFVLVSFLSWIYSNFKMFELNANDAMDEVLASVSNLVIITDANFTIKIKNDLAKEVLFSATKNRNLSLLEILGQSSDLEISDFEQNIKRLGKGDQYEANFCTKKEGVERSYFLIVTKVFQKQTHNGYSFVAMDISSMVEKEKQLQSYNEQLENKNDELERFAYIASHDLKTPLRNVTSFLSLLKRRLKDNPDPDVNDFINIAQSNAQSMYNLIEEILEYSLVKSETVKMAEVDMNEVMFLIEKNLTHYLDEKNATIKYNPLPTIKANHHQMVQLFQNLIENGLKYNNSSEPKVTISFFKEAEFLVFKVEDNGIGINPEYHKKIFEIFKRLHNQSEYQGSGVGLAICNKIVSNHEGHIELISVENVGSIFMVHLKVKIFDNEPLEIMKSLN